MILYCELLGFENAEGKGGTAVDGRWTLKRTQMLTENTGIHNREIEREVSVAEVMNKAVIVMDINSDIPAIAREMVSRDAGSVIITENGKGYGNHN